ncbi:MAG: trypsin-like peptidase domain-containing protein [Xanthomonadales bacterium]|nr:trypsin-like peptidase domain-containing protein [Xanthomonadales bacterium]
MTGIRSTARALLVAAGLLLAGTSAATELAAPVRVDEKVVVPDSTQVVAEQWRAPLLAKMAAASVRLLDMDPARVQSVQAANASAEAKAWQIGIGRDLRSETDASDLQQLAWEPVAGGVVARLDVVSPGAAALRVGLALADAPDGLEIRVAGTVHPQQVHLARGTDARQLLDAEGLFWTAVTDGERQRLELFLPADAASAVSAVSEEGSWATRRLPLRRISHLLLAPNSGDALTKALGSSGSCNIDVACRASLGEAFQRAKDAVAHMVFQSGGGTYVCTGTLLNDSGNTGRNWFYTAQHCIENQTVANTLVTFWQYEVATCGGGGAGLNRQMTGGAHLRWSSAERDAALLELRGQLPAGIAVTRAGWDSALLTVNQTVHAIHHPSGDRKKYSRGTYTGPINASYGGPVVATSRVVWNQGTTEGGSSGSGLFTDGGATFHFRGGLVGGQAACGVPAAQNWDGYSRLDLVFPQIAQFLVSETADPGPSRDYTGAWYVPSESGWGLLLHQYPDQLFATWFTFDGNGRRAWYSLLPEWTADDVASGTVQRPSGPRWGPTFNPGQVNFAPAGSFSLTFLSDRQARFTFNVDNVQRTVTLHRLGVP